MGRTIISRLVPMAVLLALAVSLAVLAPAPATASGPGNEGGPIVLTWGDDASVSSNPADASLQTVVFGAYAENHPYDEPLPIEWYVLDRDADGRCLLLSVHALDDMWYFDDYGIADATWETSIARSWLNGEFIDAAFSDAERAHILLTDVDNTFDHPEWPNVTGGANTQDLVFLLSIDEMSRYFGVEPSSLDDIDPFSQEEPDPLLGATYAEGGQKTSWWLRSPASRQDFASFVDTQGRVWTGTDGAQNGNRYGMRPAMWVDASAVAGLENVPTVREVLGLPTDGTTQAPSDQQEGTESVQQPGDTSIVDANGSAYLVSIAYERAQAISSYLTAENAAELAESDAGAYTHVMYEMLGLAELSQIFAFTTWDDMYAGVYTLAPDSPALDDVYQGSWNIYEEGLADDVSRFVQAIEARANVPDTYDRPVGDWAGDVVVMLAARESSYVFVTRFSQADATDIAASTYLVRLPDAGDWSVPVVSMMPYDSFVPASPYPAFTGVAVGDRWVDPLPDNGVPSGADDMFGRE